MKSVVKKENTTESIKALVRVALGKEKADLVIRNGSLVNVYSGEVLEGYSVAVKGKKIAFVGKDGEHTIGQNTQVIDATGKILAPGFIDGHFHAFMSIDDFLEYSMPGGTTSMFIELLDIGGIAGTGLNGIMSLLNNLKAQPVKFFGLAPSPYPPPSFLKPQDIPISNKDVERLLQREDVVGLGESLWTCVIDENKQVISNIARAAEKKKALEGHSAGAKGNKLVAFAAAGISSCHESINVQEALDKLRLGIYVMVREGSIRRDLEAISVIKDKNIDFRRLVLVTDGIMAEDLLKLGHMEHLVQKAIDLGFPPVTAIQMATINVAEHFGLDNLIGGIAPGRYADILILPGLKKIEPEYVISNGQVIAKDKRLLVYPRQCVYTKSVMKSIHIPRLLMPKDFDILVGDEKEEITVRAMKLITEVIAQECHVKLPIKHGSVLTDIDQDTLKVSIIERINNTGKLVTGFIQGFGLKSGACACSYTWELGSPIVVVGVDNKDMAKAVNRVVELQGGIVVCRDEKIMAEVAFPIAGFMAKGRIDEIATKFGEVNKAIATLGSSLTNPFVTLQTIPGTFLPYFRITLQGFVDLKNEKIVDLVVK